MDVLTESEIQEINTNSKLVKKIAELIDRESAMKMLNKKIELADSGKTPLLLQKTRRKKQTKGTQLHDN
jgi:hypothetical protein